MATLTSRSLVDDLIANDGHYSDDPRVAEIVEYTNQADAICWGVTYVTEPLHMRHRYRQATAAVRNPRVIWPPIDIAPVEP